MLHSEQRRAYFCFDLGIVGSGIGEFWDLLITSILNPVSDAGTCHQDEKAIKKMGSDRNGLHFADDIFKCMLSHENHCTLI